MNLIKVNNQKKAWKKPTLKKLSIKGTYEGDGDNSDGDGFAS